MRPYVEMVGKRFGRLTVIRVSALKRGKSKSLFWVCSCSCGNEAVVNGSRLRSKNGTKSCGCFRRDVTSARVKVLAKTHGMSKTHFYQRWIHMKVRIGHSHKEGYKWYRGKSIIWKTFEEFKTDMYQSYLRHARIHGKHNTTLDRIDTNGNYCKENCRWATTSVQGNNRANCHYITFRGKKRTISQWAKEIGCTDSTIHCRLRAGMSPAEAVSVPIDKSKAVRTQRTFGSSPIIRTTNIIRKR